MHKTLVRIHHCIPTQIHVNTHIFTHIHMCVYAHVYGWGWGWGWDWMDRSMDLCIYRRWMYGCIQPGFEVVPRPFNKYDGSLKHCNVLYIWCTCYFQIPAFSCTITIAMVKTWYQGFSHPMAGVASTWVFFKLTEGHPLSGLGAPWQRGS